MNPAFSVIFLTTLIGAGQGLFMSLVTGQVYSLANLLEPQDSVSFYAMGSALALVLLGGGLVAAVFHLGKPRYFLTRAWRGVTQWRTSWLSREVIALPLAMGLIGLVCLITLHRLQPRLGVVLVAVPEVREMSPEDATTAIETAGLTVGEALGGFRAPELGLGGRVVAAAECGHPAIPVGQGDAAGRHHQAHHPCESSWRDHGRPLSTKLHAKSAPRRHRAPSLDETTRV